MGALATEAHDRLRPYLPRLLIQWLAEAPEDVHREVTGSIAFVDISGFTKLSERLARRGKVGAEELTDAIGACFTRLLGVAYGNGGGLIKFGGDALLLLFTGADYEAKACRAAVGMRRALREIGAIGSRGERVSLRMSVGVHSGAFNFFLVGDSHRELVITGPAASQTVLMESTATAGEILVSPVTADALPAGATGDTKGPGVLLRREPRGLSPDRADVDAEDLGVDLLGCIPVAVRDRLVAGVEEPEHKLVTVAFVHYDGTDALIEHEGPPAAADFLNRLVGDVQRAVDGHGICFLGTDIDHDGGKIIITAGAPAATGNDEERMLLALREIVNVERALPVRVGVNRGHVFAGDIGPAYRRTYTVMGDAVNLAARLMAKAAPGEILSTDGVLAQSRTGFHTRALEPFTVKGKAQPVTAFAVDAVAGARDDDPDQRAPLVGREREMEVLQDALDAACAGNGRVVELIGEAGIGKSRLIEELKDRALSTLQLSAACQLYESSTPYLPFRGLLRAALGLPDDPAEARARLRQVLEDSAPSLMPWEPLVAIPLDLDVPSTPEVDRLDDKFRTARLQDAVRMLLVAVLGGPVLFTFEDAHWMDEASSNLLRRLTGDLEGVPWLFCVTRRDVDTGFTAPDGDHVVALRPEPLDASAATALVDAVSGDSPLAPHEIEALAERSGGNPLFLKELLAAARAAGGIEGLPDSVEAVIMARIDTLDPLDRSVLRRLSVLGQQFDRDLAGSVLEGGVPDRGDSIWRRLGEFIGDDGAILFFRHALIRDGAYEGLPYRLRRRLHGLVGERLEREAGDRTEDVGELLSLHFFHASAYERAWWYSTMAAERAREIFANVEAAEFYDRALVCSRHLGSVVPGTEVARVYEALGDVRNRIGENAKAAVAFRLARRLTSEDPVATSRLLVKQGRVRQQSGGYSQALRALGQANRILESIDGVDASRQRAQIAVAYASVHKDQGRPPRVIKWCFRAVREAVQASDKDALAHAYLLLDAAYVALGQGDRAVYSGPALELYEELGDLWGQGVVLNNMGTQAYWRGQWNEAVGLYQRGREAWEKIGDVVNAAGGTFNVAEILSDQGDLVEAEALFRAALRVWRSAAFRPGVAYATSALGRIASRSGRFGDAMRLLDEARAEFQQLGAGASLLETDARIAECYVFQGAGTEALEAAISALERGADAGPLAPMLLRVKGWALQQKGDPAGAREAFERSVQVAQELDADYEAALGLRALERLRGEGEEGESSSTLERFGVLRLFEAPTSAGAARVELRPALP